MMWGVYFEFKKQSHHFVFAFKRGPTELNAKQGLKEQNVTSLLYLSCALFVILCFCLSLVSSKGDGKL